MLETYARLGFYEGYWSPWIVEEMARGVTWQWVRAKGVSRESQNELSRLAKVAMRHLEPTLSYPAAVWAGADYVVVVWAITHTRQ